MTPNPADPGATVTVTGTVTNANGSPGAGTVQLYVSACPSPWPPSRATRHARSCQALTALQLYSLAAARLAV